MSDLIFKNFFLGAMLSAGLSTGYALETLDDVVLGQIVGEGIAIPFEDLRLQFAPTSFIEFTGTDPGAVTTLKRGDIRYYGLSMSSSTSGTGMDWFGNACTDGTRKLGCPMSNAGITNFANFDNPYVIRVFPYTKVDLAGNTTQSSVLEFIGPTNTDTFRWAFWGEIESDRGGATNAILKNHTMILGKPVTFTKSPSIYGTNTATNPNLGSVMQYLQYSGESTFGMIYNSRLSGDFRFSVNQVAAGSDVRGVVPDFTDVEGLYVTDVNAFLPLGQLNYQTITFNDTQPNSGVATNNGNFVVELTSIPNTVNVYNDFYSLPTALAAATSCDATCQSLNRGYNRVTSAAPAHYHDTHGFVEWGYKYPTCGNSNCMSGTGASTVRFVGTDPDGATRTITNAEFGGTVVEGGTPQVGGVVTGATASVDTLRAEGGLSFSSRTGTTWQVLNNQSRPQYGANPAPLTGGAAPSLAEIYSTNCGFFQACNNNAGRRANADYLNNYNPLITMSSINTGSARMTGININHLKITSLGAN